MELVLEQSQQGSSHEVSVSTEGVKELKRIGRITGVKKEALHTTLGRNRKSFQSQHQTALRYSIHTVKQSSWNRSDGNDKVIILQVQKKKDGIFISQDKYVAEILRKFRLIEGKSVSTPIDTKKPLLKDPDGEDIDVHTYRKSTTRRCQFLGCRLISWQCKKQTVVATLSTEAEYVAAASCCAQVLWIQNQLLDYG
nr:ribonuclease H-like domain, reverse transcriptase, RNA-dependent DNA polymerase [Tanacetum cinerariifolium]